MFPAADFVEDGIGVGGPDKRFGIGIGFLQEAVDGDPEIGDAFEPEIGDAFEDVLGRIDIEADDIRASRQSGAGRRGS